MFRPASRSVLRAAQSSLSPARTTSGRRFLSTEPPHLRSRSWKSSALRWGVAIAGIYYYNTSPVFAEQPQSNLLNPNLHALDDSNETSPLEGLTSRRTRTTEKNAQVLHSAVDSVSSENASTSISGHPGAPIDAASPAAAELEEEAEEEGAFNPETGEINWDCPCLGGMAHGPCGPEFREAFSCFVFSKEEPKGMDCIEKFQGMRDCFQKHPDVYKDELMEDEEIDREVEAERQELAQQIADRHKADHEGGRRLLEEAPPEPRPAKSTRITKGKTSESTSKPGSPDGNVTNGSRLSATEGTTSASAPELPTTLATDATLSGDDVVPAAASDASDAVAGGDGKSKS